MTRSTVSYSPLAFAAAAVILLGGFSSLALAQGTDAQREACTPDAIRLCQDTIPDVGKTTACMKAHEAELSPRCHRVFVASGPASRITRSGRRRVAATETPTMMPAETPPAMTLPASPSLDRGIDVSGFDVDVPDTRESRARDAEDLRKARRVVRRLCRNAILDPTTCQLTQGAMNLAR